MRNVVIIGLHQKFNVARSVLLEVTHRNESVATNWKEGRSRKSFPKTLVSINFPKFYLSFISNGSYACSESILKKGNIAGNTLSELRAPYFEAFLRVNNAEIRVREGQVSVHYAGTESAKRTRRSHICALPSFHSN
jgi:hypothetical protein